jgi:thiol-disulfide isomerase/thioredoxin
MLGVIRMANLNDVSEECPSCRDYIEDMSPYRRERWQQVKENYKLNKEALEKLRKYKDDYTFVAVFADWCGDARKAIPVLALLEKELDIKIRALGGMTKPPFGSEELWAIPPSPEEVGTFEINSSPTILIFDEDGEEVGRIKTKAKNAPTIEEEIVFLIEQNE